MSRTNSKIRLKLARIKRGTARRVACQRISLQLRVEFLVNRSEVPRFKQGCLRSTSSPRYGQTFAFRSINPR